MALPTIESRSNVRPTAAVISCAHLWAMLLLVAGVAEFIIGAMLFTEWRGLGCWWIGAMAIGSGVAGLYVSGEQPAGGQATGFFASMSLLTIVLSALSIALGDGISYIVVKETDGNCVETDLCLLDSCGERDCVCWEPDGSVLCSVGDSLRYCFHYAGESCSDIEESESLLLGSTIMLFIIGVFSICSLLVSINTCCFCKRVMVVESTTPADQVPASFN